jgi:hypothetical protein
MGFDVWVQDSVSECRSVLDRKDAPDPRKVQLILRYRSRHLSGPPPDAPAPVSAGIYEIGLVSSHTLV